VAAARKRAAVTVRRAAREPPRRERGASLRVNRRCRSTRQGWQSAGTIFALRRAARCGCDHGTIAHRDRRAYQWL